MKRRTFVTTAASGLAALPFAFSAIQTAAQTAAGPRGVTLMVFTPVDVVPV